MAKPTPQDQFIDDDDEEEVCPLCVEEFDLTDKGFRPCPCGYQICQFCYNNIKTTMNGLCPACRRQYDERTIQYKAVSPEELAQHRQNIAQQAKKKAAAKQKEAQKREADHLSRKHLAGLRVRQRNLVYVTGLKPKVTGDKLVEGLRSKDFFGQYGEIIKVVVSKSNAQNQSVGVYVTFKNKEDAASCIQTIDGHKLPDGNRLRAQYGTTKYCSAYLRGDNCPNRNCMFLHEPGEDSESFTRQDLSSLNAISSQQVPSSSTPVPGPSQLPAPPAPSNQDEEALQSPLESPSAGPALPATASWGDQVRRLSRATTSASSPLAKNPMLASQQEKAPKDQPKQRKREAKPKKDRQEESLNPHFDDLLKKAFPPGMKFVYAHPPHFTEEDKWIVENMPPLFDLRIPRRKRELREREAAERMRQHHLEAQMEAQGGSPFEADDGVDAAPGGSSQLGGEPEERGFSQSSVLSPQVIGSAHGHSQNAGMPEELSGLGSTRNPAPQATQHMLLQQLKSGSSTQGSTSNHGRQPSRYFLNEAPGAALKGYQKQPAPAQPQYSAQSPGVGGHFNYSNVQGPPPGLKTSGTPPVSGGGMFAQGHGFAQGFGRENDKFWELRGRAASGPDGKRELPFPYNQYPSTSAATPTAGVYSFPYGSQAPAYPDPGPQKQKKKGKKHRHANTSSSGGGVVDVADPSILQMRVGSAMAGQGYSGQGQDSHSSTDQPGTAQDEAPDVDASAGAEVPLQRTVGPSPPLVPPLGLSQPADTLASDERQVQPAASDPLPDEPVALAVPVAKLPSKEHKPAPQAGKDDSSVAKPDVVLQATPAASQDPAKASSSKEKATRSASESAEKEPKALSRRESKRAASKTKDKSSTVEKPPLETKGQPRGAENEENVWAKRTKASTLRISTKVPEEEEKEARERELAASTKAELTAGHSQLPASPRPPTPGTMTVDSPAKRAAPRTLRITDTPKTETPKTELPSIPPSALVTSSKVSSRRHSLTSNNQPGTPSSDQVDISSVPSATPSRATSPAPVVGKKRADKKAKKQKKREEEEAQAAPPAEEHSPVLSRVKKSRKPTGALPRSASAAVASLSAPDVKVDEKAKPEPTIPESNKPMSANPEPMKPEPSKPAMPESSKSSKAASGAPDKLGSSKPDSSKPARPWSPKSGSAKLGSTTPDLMEDVGDEDAPPSPPTKPLESTKSQRKFFASLGPHLDHLVNSSSFTKPVSSTSHLDGLDWPRSFPAAIDWTNHLAQISKPFVLTPEEEAERAAGRPVRRQASNGRISGRIIETIRGTRLRKLSQQEEDELVRLEESINSVKGAGFWGGARAVDFVSSNYNGLCPLDASTIMQPKSVLPENSFILEDVLAYGHTVDPMDLINCFVLSRDDDDVDMDPPPAAPGSAAGPGRQSSTNVALAGNTEGATANAAALLAGATAIPGAPASAGGPLDAEAAAAAAAAAAAIGSTAAYLQEAISQDKVLGLGEVIGRAVENATGALSDEMERAWMEERKRTEELEARLHELIKKNRQLIMEGCL